MVTILPFVQFCNQSECLRGFRSVPGPPGPSGTPTLEELACRDRLTGNSCGDWRSVIAALSHVLHLLGPLGQAVSPSMAGPFPVGSAHRSSFTS